MDPLYARCFASARVTISGFRGHRGLLSPCEAVTVISGARVAARTLLESRIVHGCMRLLVAGDLSIARSGTSSGLSLGSRSVAGTSGPGVSGKLHRERIGQSELGLCGGLADTSNQGQTRSHRRAACGPACLNCDKHRTLLPPLRQRRPHWTTEPAAGRRQAHSRHDAHRARARPGVGRPGAVRAGHARNGGGQPADAQATREQDEHAIAERPTHSIKDLPHIRFAKEMYRCE